MHPAIVEDSVVCAGQSIAMMAPIFEWYRDQDCGGVLAPRPIGAEPAPSRRAARRAERNGGLLRLIERRHRLDDAGRPPSASRSHESERVRAGAHSQASSSTDATVTGPAVHVARRLPVAGGPPRRGRQTGRLRPTVRGSRSCWMIGVVHAGPPATAAPSGSWGSSAGGSGARTSSKSWRSCSGTTSGEAPQSDSFVP